MIKLIKKYYIESKTGRKLFYPLKRFYDFYWVNLVSEKAYLKHLYQMTCGGELDLDNPQTIQEKLLWLRFHNKKPLYTKCSDKYLVRSYVEEKIGDKYLIPLVLQTKNPKDIIATNLPDYPVIIKTNHGCGGHIVIKDKNSVNYKKLQKYFKRMLKQNFYYRSRQWQYKNIEPCIIVEEHLQEKNNKKVTDFKLHCYNGKVDRIEVYRYHANDNGKDLMFYTLDWKKLDMSCRTLKNNGEIPKPKNLSEMIEIAEILASDFKFVRVDTYNLDGNIFVGELTFTPAMGTQGYRPEPWSKILGDKLQL